MIRKTEEEEEKKNINNSRLHDVRQPFERGGMCIV